MELLRITTAGSVDDGKSTLIGRLLYDCNDIFEDQMAAIIKTSNKLGEGRIDLSLITDGLAAEREQGITIDVAYRYFSTRKRRFILADVPGHEQYTKNMITGASNSNLAMILVDASKGILVQSKRHLFIASLLEIPHILVVVNKMDAVGYEESFFDKIKSDFEAFAAKMSIRDMQFIPVSALEGDMVVKRHDNMPWYNGRTVLDYLENVQISSDRNLIDFRFPVQSVIKVDKNLRAYTGSVEGGVVSVGEDVIVLPSLKKSKIKSIISSEKEVDSAFNPQSVALVLEDEIDVSRGDMIVRENNIPEISNELEAIICWMGDVPLELGNTYIVKHTTKTVRGSVHKLHNRLNIDTLHREKTQNLKLNDIGRILLKTNEPLFFDQYAKNRNTGAFILIDEVSNSTVGAGIVLRKSQKLKSIPSKENLHVNKGVTLWFTGLSGAGKSSIANALNEMLEGANLACERLDGDDLRKTLCKDLGFTKEDRFTNIERAGFVANLLSRNKVLVLASFITPYQEQRDNLRYQIDDFVEIFVKTPQEICRDRDVKGLYSKAKNGEIDNFTSVSDPFENPQNPDIIIDTQQLSVSEAAQMLFDYLKENGFIGNNSL